MRFFTLASSSAGNVAFFGDSEGGLLIDAGLSARKITAGLKEKGICPEQLEGILLTHEHIDHVKGLYQLTKQYQLPVYGDQTVLLRLRAEGKLWPDTPLVFVKAGRETKAGRFGLLPIAVSHDAIAPLAYRIRLGETEGAIFTDTGCADKKMLASLAGIQMILLESNYEAVMLANGPYPYQLKRRISSEFGHLSNQQAGEIASFLYSQGTTRFVLGHLSKENNLPLLAKQAICQALGEFSAKEGRDFQLAVAPPDDPMEVLLF